ncbi:hypothetical protein PCANC_03536 [Puccinia coronata f. sp. avenae]|uniref:Uncharacterized protein n=1 Tax=Puccinia coronata f. sp. avenae TaxID=200324 RepID=A0A2N5W013_9BASI|nr:hypothetical protein PCANC_16892 [Puccinia coronata f. sp. avenae]PLW47077.1 hypothetical protein PCASD_03903 [Puccinia coronata f. sp. avenae]PLW55589.1 hypothetical protein PCANC_03536 [Puccinia coronata f. sp. avenae]
MSGCLESLDSTPDPFSASTIFSVMYGGFRLRTDRYLESGRTSRIYGMGQLKPEEIHTQPILISMKM